MVEKDEGTVARLIRFLALGFPMFSRVLAVALVLAAVVLAFVDVGGYDEGTRADLAMLLAALALLVLALGRAVPWLMLRFLPPRR
jgi:hypothetical protein